MDGQFFSDGLIFGILIGILTEVIYRAVNRRGSPFSRRNGRWIQGGIFAGVLLAWTATHWVIQPQMKGPQYHVHFWMMAGVVGGVIGALSHFVYSLFHPTAPAGEFRRPGLPDLDRQVRESWGAKAKVSEESATGEDVRIE